MQVSGDCGKLRETRSTTARAIDIFLRLVLTGDAGALALRAAMLKANYLSDMSRGPILGTYSDRGF